MFWALGLGYAIALTPFVELRVKVLRVSETPYENEALRPR